MEPHVALAARMMDLPPESTPEDIEAELENRYGLNGENFSALCDDIIRCTSPSPDPYTGRMTYALGKPSQDNPDDWQAHISFTQTDSSEALRSIKCSWELPDLEGNTGAEIDVIVELREPGGAPVELSFWEYALDYFARFDNPSEFFEDGDYWHSEDNHLLTGTTFQFDLNSLDPRAPSPRIEGKAIRFLARENDRGDISTYTDEKTDVVSRIKCRMTFADPEQAWPFLLQLREETGY